MSRFRPLLAFTLVLFTSVDSTHAQPVIFEEVSVDVGFTRYEDLMSGARGGGLAGAAFAVDTGSEAAWSNRAPLFSRAADLDWSSSMLRGYQPALVGDDADRTLLLHSASFAMGSARLAFGTRGYDEDHFLVRTASEPDGILVEGLSRRDYTASVAYDLGSVLLPPDSWLWSVGAGYSWFSTSVRGIRYEIGGLELGTTAQWRRASTRHEFSFTGSIVGLNSTSNARRFESNDLQMPDRVRAGFTAALARRPGPGEAPWVRGALSVAFTNGDGEDADSGTHLGFELGFHGRVFLRAGREDVSFDDFTTFGVGVEWPIRDLVVLRASYAHQRTTIELLTPFDDVDISHDVFDLGLSAGF